MKIKMVEHEHQLIMADQNSKTQPLSQDDSMNINTETSASNSAGASISGVETMPSNNSLNVVMDECVDIRGADDRSDASDASGPPAAAPVTPESPPVLVDASEKIKHNPNRSRQNHGIGGRGVRNFLFWRNAPSAQVAPELPGEPFESANDGTVERNEMNDGGLEGTNGNHGGEDRSDGKRDGGEGDDVEEKEEDWEDVNVSNVDRTNDDGIKVEANNMNGEEGHERSHNPKPQDPAISATSVVDKKGGDGKDKVNDININSPDSKGVRQIQVETDDESLDSLPPFFSPVSRLSSTSLDSNDSPAQRRRSPNKSLSNQNNRSDEIRETPVTAKNPIDTTDASKEDEGSVSKTSDDEATSAESKSGNGRLFSRWFRKPDPTSATASSESAPASLQQSVGSESAGGSPNDDTIELSGDGGKVDENIDNSTSKLKETGNSDSVVIPASNDVESRIHPPSAIDTSHSNENEAVVTPKIESRCTTPTADNTTDKSSKVSITIAPPTENKDGDAWKVTHISAPSQMSTSRPKQPTSPAQLQFNPNMEIILNDTIPGASIQDYFNVAWSEGKHFSSDFPPHSGTHQYPALYGPWLTSCRKNNVVVHPWETIDGSNATTAETDQEMPSCYTHHRVVTFDFKKVTIGRQSTVQVLHMQQCRVSEEQCVVHMSISMKGFPYAECFVVEVRHVATSSSKVRDETAGEGEAAVQQDQTQEVLDVQIGLQVRFVKPSLMEWNIRKNTSAETKKAQMDLFDTIKKACLEEVERKMVEKIAAEEVKKSNVDALKEVETDDDTTDETTTEEGDVLNEDAADVVESPGLDTTMENNVSVELKNWEEVSVKGLNEESKIDSVKPGDQTHDDSPTEEIAPLANVVESVEEPTKVNLAHDSRSNNDGASKELEGSNDPKLVGNSDMKKANEESKMGAMTSEDHAHEETSSGDTTPLANAVNDMEDPTEDISVPSESQLDNDNGLEEVQGSDDQKSVEKEPPKMTTFKDSPLSSNTEDGQQVVDECSDENNGSIPTHNVVASEVNSFYDMKDISETEAESKVDDHLPHRQVIPSQVALESDMAVEKSEDDTIDSTVPDTVHESMSQQQPDDECQCFICPKPLQALFGGSAPKPALVAPSELRNTSPTKE